MVMLLAINLMLVFMMGLWLYPSSSSVVEVLLFSLFGKDIFVVFFWDLMSFFFCLVVLVISAVVFFYSNYYMDGESVRLGFMILLFSFVASMILLLLSPSFLTLLLGWDGLGMTSYLLVIYYSSYSSSTAGMLTFLVNRLGDVFFMLALGAFSLQFSWEKVSSTQLVMGMLILLALSTKSAQLPFSAWLPAAMAAPTPVSSLVHSSTLVTAGLYLMIRFSFLLEGFNFLIVWAGVMTLLAAGLMAVFEWDLKKLIAFSTLSQLGFMVSAFGMGMIWVSYFHLLTHALFKASLFLSAGVLIHNADNSQEFRNMFLIPFQLYWISGVINICLMCLCGIPFTSGFYSKDMIVDGGSFTLFLFVFYLLGVCLTIIYSSRFFIFSSRFFGVRLSLQLAYEKVRYLYFPLFLLVMFAMGGGWFFFESLFSWKFYILLSGGWKILYFLFLLFFFWLSYFISSSVKLSYTKKYFFSSIWFLKSLCSSKLWGLKFNSFSNILKSGDQGVLETGGPQGVFKTLLGLGLSAFSSQSFIFALYFLTFLWSAQFM